MGIYEEDKDLGGRYFPDVRESDRGLDKIQMLFADMEERTKAWQELSEVEGLELVGSLGYNIEINAAGVNKGSGLVSLGRLLGDPA